MKILIIILTLISFNVNSAEIKLVNENTISFEGSIEKGDFIKLSKFTTKPNMTIELNSDGGLLSQSILIGYLVNELDMQTAIKKDAECHSGCGLIFLAGSNRIFDGVLGIHCASIKGTKECYEPGNKKMFAFVEDVAPSNLEFYKKNAQQLKMKIFVNKK